MLSLVQIVVVLAMVVFVPLCFWKTLVRTGRPGWLGLFAIIPLVGIVLLGVLAFGRWPAIDAPRDTDKAVG
jgi:uncharacterized membrane protein